jgi:formate hydrogenlyase subunit 3/multisubunit Na+/H+ antiporter MnhD subunit
MMRSIVIAAIAGFAGLVLLLAAAQHRNYVGIGIGSAVMVAALVAVLVAAPGYRRRRSASRESGTSAQESPPARVVLTVIVPSVFAAIGLVGGILYLPTAIHLALTSSWAVESLFGLLVIAGAISLILLPRTRR